MRLIDADRLRELYEDCEGLKVSCELVLQNIDDQSTAYDVGAVLSELEHGPELIVGDAIFKGTYLKKSQVIEIVKRGGRDKWAE